MGGLETVTKGNVGKIKKNRSSDTIMEIVMYVISALFLIILIYPLYFIVIASFSDPSAVAGGRFGYFLKGSPSMVTKSCCVMKIFGLVTGIPSCIRW